MGAFTLIRVAPRESVAFSFKVSNLSLESFALLFMRTQLVGKVLLARSHGEDGSKVSTKTRTELKIGQL